MEEQSILLQAIDSGALDARLSDVCGCGAEGLAHKRARLSGLLHNYGAAFGRWRKAGRLDY